MVFGMSTAYADDDTKSDTNSNMANVSEEASKRDVYGAKASGTDSKGSNIEDLLGNKYTSTPNSESNKGLNSVAASWSFLGLNTDSGLLKPGDADTAEVSLQSLIIYNTKGDSTSNAVLKAASLPAVLQKNGLDTTKMGGLNSVARFVMGWLLMIALALAFIANAIIAFVIWLIGSLNPFVIIQSLMNSSGYGLLNIPSSWGNIPLIGNLVDKNNMFGQIANLILSWSIPTLIIMIFAIVITMLFWVPYSRRSRTQGTLMSLLKKVLKHLAVLLILPSIAGSIFMSLYSLSANGVEAPARSVQNLVQSTFVEFGAWSDHSRLYIPPTDKYNNGIALKADVPVDNDSNSATKWRYKTPEQVPITPSYILAINALGARTTDAHNAFTQSSTFEWSGLQDSNSSSGGSSTANNGNGDTLPDLKKNIISDNMNKIAGLKTTFSMVDSWLSADRYSASSYAGTIENQYNAANKDKQQSYDQAGEIIKDIKKPSDDKAVSQYLQTSKNAIRYDMNKGFYSNNVASVPGANTVESLIGKDSVYAGLSSVGMWNYLNSKVDKGTLTQNDPRKTQNKDATTHANVVLPGGAVLGFLSIAVIIAFIAATTFPTLAVSILLGKMAMEMFTGWDKIIFAMGGSIKAWMKLVQFGIKLIVGIFMLGFLSMITPSIASFIITTLDGLFAGTNSWGGYVVGKALEVVALLAVAGLLYVAFKNSITFFDTLVPNAMRSNPGDPAGAAKSIFDREFGNTMDSMTSGSNSKLGRMLNEANEYDARHNENLAHSPNGDLLKDSDGRWGLDSDADWREGIDGRKYQYLKNKEERAKERAEDRERLMENWANGSEANKLAKENELKEKVSDAHNALRKMGIDIPTADEANATEKLKDIVKDDLTLNTPEVQQAVEDMQSAAEALNEISDAREAKENQTKLDKFVKSPLLAAGALAKHQGAEMKNAAMETEAGKLVSAYANARNNIHHSDTPAEAAAKIAQQRKLKEGLDVDDSLFGGMTSEAQEALEENSFKDLENISSDKVNENLNAFRDLAPKEGESLSKELDELSRRKTIVEAKTQELQSKDGKYSAGSNILGRKGDILREVGKSRLNADGHRKPSPNEVTDAADQALNNLQLQEYHPDNQHYGNALNALQANEGGIYGTAERGYVNKMLNQWGSRPENNMNLSQEERNRQKEQVKKDAIANFKNSTTARNQATNMALNSFDNSSDRVAVMEAAQVAQAKYLDDQVNKLMPKLTDPDVLREQRELDPNYDPKLEATKAVVGNYLSNQPRNYGIFTSNARENMKTMERKEAIQEAFKHATTRNDEYRLLPRDFGERALNEQVMGPEYREFQSGYAVLDSEHEALTNKISNLTEQYKSVTPTDMIGQLRETGYRDFQSRNVNKLPVMKKYITPNASRNLTAGQIYEPLRKYTALSDTYAQQKPITGKEFTSAEKVARKHMEDQMNALRTSMIKSGVSEYALNDAGRTRQMFRDFKEAREKLGSVYVSMEDKINRI